MTGADPPDLSPRSLFSFNTHSDIDQYALGSDADIGGYSTVHLDLVDSTEKGKRTAARFWGDMRLDVRPPLKGKVRAGYAGFRNKVCPSFTSPYPSDSHDPS
jgi:NADH dehydrogenase [ubiquinone] 1 alpha subcomplex assembly factor 1